VREWPELRLGARGRSGIRQTHQPGRRALNCRNDAPIGPSAASEPSAEAQAVTDHQGTRRFLSHRARDRQLRFPLPIALCRSIQPEPQPGERDHRHHHVCGRQALAGQRPPAPPTCAPIPAAASMRACRSHASVIARLFDGAGFQVVSSLQPPERSRVAIVRL
jgi:hypothetical protein